jgi:multidrug efflux pump subunit AcrA (membrane-fusion protein)
VPKLQQAQAAQVQAKQELDRQTNLYQTKVNDLRDLQNAQDSYAAAQANTAAAEADLQTAQLNLSYTKIFAPVDGYLTNMNTSPRDLCLRRGATSCARRFQFVLGCCLFHGDATPPYPGGQQGIDHLHRSQ